MKDKRAEQIARKQLHKTELKAAKRRRGVPLFEFEQPTRLERQRILIVCEGANTERTYFQQFRLTSAEILALGAGCDTVRVVERAREEQRKGKYDQVWVVFDKDDFPANNFNNAIFMAEEFGFGVAYSNQAFEYWLILHFEDHQGGGMHRDDYHDKLNWYLQRLGLYYDGKESKVITKEIFDILLAIDHQTNNSRIQLALRRARRVYDQYLHKNPAAEESSTTVFRLVEEILRYI